MNIICKSLIFVGMSVRLRNSNYAERKEKKIHFHDISWKKNRNRKQVEQELAHTSYYWLCRILQIACINVCSINRNDKKYNRKIENLVSIFTLPHPTLPNCIHIYWAKNEEMRKTKVFVCNDSSFSTQDVVVWREVLVQSLLRWEKHLRFRETLCLL